MASTTKVTKALTPYGVVGNREQLSNVIANIDPFGTPFLTFLKRRNTKGKVFECQTESLPSLDIATEVDGFQTSTQDAIVTQRKLGTTQIMSRNFVVAGAQEASDAAGKPGGEMNHQKALASKALKRNREASYLSAQARVAGEDSTPVARKTRGLDHWIQTNVSKGASYSAPANDTSAQTDGTKRPFEEELLLDAHQMCFDNGADPKMLLLGSYAQRKIAGFTGRTTSMVEVKAGEVSNYVEVYRSPYGKLNVMPSRFSRVDGNTPGTIGGTAGRTAFLIDHDYAADVIFRDYTEKKRPIDGDAEGALLLIDAGLEITNEKAHGAIKDLCISKAEEDAIV